METTRIDLSVDDARAAMLAAVAPIDARERVPLAVALGRVTASELRAPVDVPPAATSAMDGVAVRWDDLAAHDFLLPVLGRAAAGEPRAVLAPGSAMRIFTGAVVPEGADTVVMVEDTETDGGFVRVRAAKRVRRGANVRAAGDDLARGDVALPAGRRLWPHDLGVAASVGVDALDVVRPPRVAVVVTGDELVAPGGALAPGQLHDSNGPMVRALLEALGAHVTEVRRAPDDAIATRAALLAAADAANLVVSTGGVSVGEEDHVKAAVRAEGRLDLWRVAIKPGKPVGFGRVATTPWLGLPGNPAALLINFLLFAGPLVRRLQGRPAPFPAPLAVAAGFAHEAHGGRETVYRVRVDGPRVVPMAAQGSGVLASMSRSDGLVRVPAGVALAPGDAVDYFPFAELLA